jgi:hypothetical protein
LIGFYIRFVLVIFVFAIFVFAILSFVPFINLPFFHARTLYVSMFNNYISAAMICKVFSSPQKPFAENTVCDPLTAPEKHEPLY